MFDKLFLFFKDKFEVLLLWTLVLIIFFAWFQSNYNVSVKEVLMFVLGAMTALMRIVPRQTQNVQTDTIQTDSIDTANTQSGDIITSSSPDNTKTKKENS